MSFLSPLFLVGVAAGVVPLILHLLKPEPERRVRFAAVRLLRRAPIEHTGKRRLHELLLLALRVATLALLALAFARPFFPAGAAGESAGVTMVAIDTSYSMSAPGRIERARQLARDAITRAPAADLVGVLAFADAADVVAPPSANRGLALAAAGRIVAGFGATRYQAGLSAAAGALGGRRGRIVVVTDLQESGWDAGDRASLPESVRVEVADVGALPPNLAITSARTSGHHIVAVVRNSGSLARDTTVRLMLDGRLAGEMAVSVGPSLSVEALLPLAGSASAVEVAIDDPQGLQADNVRYAVIGETDRPSVLVVTATGNLGREAFYVQQALGVGGGVRQGYQIDGVGSGQLSAEGTGRLSSRAAVLLLSTRGLERRGREAIATYASSGGGVLIAAGPDVDGAVVADVLGAGAPLRMVMPADTKGELRTLAPVDVRHPIFQSFGANQTTLALVRFQQVARIGGSVCQTLARFTSGEAALVDCLAGDGRALLIASDLDNRWNDFPVHATFVPFLHEAIQYLTGGRPRAGEYLTGDPPAGLTSRPGIATVGDDSASGGRRRVAVNVDPREGDPERVSVDEFLSAVKHLEDAGLSKARVEAAEHEEGQHLWQYVLVMMIVTLVAEGLVASRAA